MATALLTGVSLIIGGLLTWWFSKYYYVRASKDLTQVSKELLQVSMMLKRMSEIGLGVLEEKGYVKLNRDEHGNIVGKIIELKGNIRGTSSVSAVEAEVE